MINSLNTSFVKDFKNLCEKHKTPIIDIILQESALEYEYIFKVKYPTENIVADLYGYQPIGVNCNPEPPQDE